MKSKSVFVVLFLFACGLLVAQQKMIDSLENQLVNPTNGKPRLENLIELGHFYSMVNPQKGLTRMDEALKIATKAKDSFLIATALGNKAKNYISLGNDSIAFNLYDQVEYIFKSIDSTKALSRLMFNKGLLYSQRSNYKKAVENLQNALEVFTTDKDTLLMGYCSGTLGFYQINFNDYSSSMKSFLYGMSLLEKINQQESIYYASIIGNKGILHQRLSEYQTALELHNQALELFQKNGQQYLVASQYAEIGNIYNIKGQYDKSLVNYKAAYAIFKKINQFSGMAETLSNIGLNLIHLKEYKKAEHSLDSAIIINKQLRNYQKLSINYHNKGELYHNINEFYKAQKNFESSLDYAIKTNDKRLIYEAKFGIAEAASALKNYKKAFLSLDEAVILKDSLLSEETENKISDLKANYKYEKEKAILEADFAKNKAIDKAKIERQIFIRNMSIIVGLVALIFLSLTFILIRTKREAEIATEKANAKLQILTSQMNPHFIFNTLNSINDYVLNNEKKKASNYLAEFSTMIRKIVKNSAYEEITLEKEIEFLQSYLRLEQKRLNNHLTFEIYVDEKIDVQSTLITPSILQTIVENSIWHGFSSLKGGLLKISFTLKKDFLICTIEDNGKGFKPNNRNEQRGNDSYGLDNVRNRLDLISKKKKVKATLKISSKAEGGVCVMLQLPLSFKF